MKVLITGGAGFVGSYLVDRLMHEGHTLTILDHFSDPAVFAFYKKTYKKPHVILRGDITGDFPRFAQYFQNVDCVFHLAGRNKNITADTNPRLYHESNVTATAYTLEASRLGKVKKFIYMASTTCYGPFAPTPTPEDSPMDPHNPYALTKFLGEAAVFHWSKVYKLPVVSLRVFSVYGPRKMIGSRKGFFLSQFIDQMKRELPITITGDGSQSRDLVYIKDVIDALIAAMESSIQNEVFNVGSGKTTSINTIVSLLGATKVEYNTALTDLTRSTQADIKKIGRLLGWKPRVFIEEGIRKTLAYEA